jgi:hypothetical protein
MANTEYPDFIKQPFELISNWTALAFPSLRDRILFQIFDSNGQSADPLLLQVPGAYGFIAPQGYSVKRIHFCNGIALGAWIQSPVKSELIYVQSKALDISI